MEHRINYNNGYLYGTYPNAAEICENYQTSQEAVAEYMPEILQQCSDRKYNEYETAQVVWNFTINWNNSACQWGS